MLVPSRIRDVVAAMAASPNSGSNQPWRGP